MKKRKLFVGNLDYAVTADQIRRFLAPHGMVINVKVMEGKGYAFVEMGSEEQAQKILRTLSESVFEGRKLLIDTVPGTHRSERKKDLSSSESRDRKPIGAIGKKPGPRTHGDGKNAPKPEFKTRDAGVRSERPMQDKQPVAKTGKNPVYQGQMSPESGQKPAKVHQKAKSVSHTPIEAPVNKEKAANPDAGKKPESPPREKQKKSRVPVWVKERRSPGNKPKKEKY